MTLSEIQRTARRTFAPELANDRVPLTKLSVSAVGSFLALRIDDPMQTLTCSVADQITRRVGHELHYSGFVTAVRPASQTYHANGWVANWIRK